MISPLLTFGGFLSERMRESDYVLGGASTRARTCAAGEVGATLPQSSRSMMVSSSGSLSSLRIARSARMVTRRPWNSSNTT